jgi:hypothetical protein
MVRMDHRWPRPRPITVERGAEDTMRTSTLLAAAAGFGLLAGAGRAPAQLLSGQVYYSICATDFDGVTYKASPNGGTPGVLGTGTYPRANRNNTRVAVLRSVNGVDSIATMAVTGGDEHVWTGVPVALFGLTSPFAWNGDGTQFAIQVHTANDAPYQLRIYTDNLNGGYTTVDLVRPIRSIDWKGNVWVVTYEKDMGSGFNAHVAAKLPAGNGSAFSDLFTPTAIAGTSPTDWGPAAFSARVRFDGTIAWQGYDTIPYQHRGIFTGAGSFKLNTGDTRGFAFSADGKYVVAARYANASTTYVDIINWSGPYVRTLASGLVCGADWGDTPLEQGDANGDGVVDVSDVFVLINYLFAGGPAPTGPADADGNLTLNVSDVFYLINFLFAGGPAPVR